jgi:hypothetical protein
MKKRNRLLVKYFVGGFLLVILLTLLFLFGCNKVDSGVLVNGSVSSGSSSVASGGGNVPAQSSVNPVGDVPSPQCGKDADCLNVCATPNGVCVSGKCSCTKSAVVVVENDCADTDNGWVGRSGFTDVNYGETGTCRTNPVSRGSVDTCVNSDVLREYYCGIPFNSRNGAECLFDEIDCERMLGTGYFCMDGACVIVV